MKSKGKVCFANKGKGKPDQDVKWYTSKSDAAIQAAQLGFTNATGAAIEYAGSHVPSIPGIMDIYYQVTIGELFPNTQAPEWNTNPFNQAIKRIYTQMRRKNTASPVYNSPDLGIYLICMDSLYNYFSYFARAYKVVNYYRNKNKYNAKALLNSMYIDDTDVLEHLADLRVYLNSFAARVNASLSVPAMSFFERHVWINSHLWKDGDTDKSQVYLPMIQLFHKYNATKTEAGGGTDTVAIDSYWEGGEYITVEGIKRMGEELLNALFNDDDILLIAADIDKWYGGNQFTLPAIQENDTLEPEFSMEVLTQIQNIDIFSISDRGFVQDVNHNTVAHSFTINSSISNGVLLAKANKQFIVMPYDNPKPEDIVVATRNTIALKLTGTSVDSISVGSEIVTQVDIRYYFTPNQVNSVSVNYIEFNPTNNDASTIMTKLSSVVLKTYFDMSPKTYILPTSTENIAYALTEFENSTPISYDRLNQIHIQALYNEFGFYDTDHSSANF